MAVSTDKVGRLVSPNAFSLASEDAAQSDDSFEVEAARVVGGEGSIPGLSEGQRVRVTGEVQRFDVKEVEQRLDTDLDDSLYAEFEEKVQQEEEKVDEAVNRFFVLPIFVLLGLALPWGEWADLGWKGPALAGLVLLLRRLPWVLALTGLVPAMRGRSDGLFTGWFGPIGVAALYYATLAEHTAGLHEAWVVGSLVISVPVLVHGVSAAPLTRLYGRRAGSGG